MVKTFKEFYFIMVDCGHFLVLSNMVKHSHLERPFGPICAMLALFALWRQMGVPTYFFRSFERVDDFT